MLLYAQYQLYNKEGASYLSPKFMKTKVLRGKNRANKECIK